MVVAHLGAGETEVLCLGLELDGAWLILDDAQARALARELGLRMLGTAAVLVEAKRAPSTLESSRPRTGSHRWMLTRTTRRGPLTCEINADISCLSTDTRAAGGGWAAGPPASGNRQRLGLAGNSLSTG